MTPKSQVVKRGEPPLRIHTWYETNIHQSQQIKKSDPSTVGEVQSVLLNGISMYHTANIGFMLQHRIGYFL